LNTFENVHLKYQSINQSVLFQAAQLIETKRTTHTRKTGTDRQTVKTDKEHLQ